MAVWGDNLALQLSIANIGIGLVCLAGVTLIVAAIVRRHRAHSRVLRDTHAWEGPGLGLIMADGGRPLGENDAPTGDWRSWDDEREFEVGE